MPSRIPAVALLLLVVPAGAAGQACAVPPGGLVAVEAGAVRYDVANRMTGAEFGADARLSSRQVAFRAGYRRAQFEHGPSPDIVRLTLSGRLGLADGWSHCVIVHGGAARWATDTDDGLVLAGGLGFGTAYPLGRSGIVPFLEVRGLGGWSTGSILDVDMHETGLSIGVEAGLTGHFGRIEARASGALDGFAPGLGVTPYPAQALRLTVGIRL